MAFFPLRHAFAVALLLCAACGSLLAGDSGRVTLHRTPDGGIQPQAVMDSSGVIHLIYYKGDPGAGDIFYVSRPAKNKEFSKPIRINSQSGSAIAAGTIRGAQLAVGKNGRVHVAWDGMGKGATRVTFGEKEVAPLLYTRMNKEGTAFEPERNVITYAFGLDGGSSVAADPQGNVYIAWHGRAPESPEGEAGRAIFVTRSQDEGKTFEREKRAVAKETGACACCGMRAFADSKGAVYILFRAATENTERGQTLLVSPRPGADFEIAYNHPWKAIGCPMSSATITEAKAGALGAWETASNVYFASIDPKTMQVSRPTSPAGTEKRKHPVAVANGEGETLLAWTEGTGWAKGGSLAWQIFDKEGKPTKEKGQMEGVPVWSLVSAVAQADGTFILFY